MENRLSARVRRAAWALGSLWVVWVVGQVLSVRADFAHAAALSFGMVGFTVVAVAACLSAAWKGLPARRRGWQIGATACALWGFGQLMWAIALLQGRTPPIPSVADVGFLGFAVLGAAALTTIIRPAGDRLGRIRSFIDAALIAGALLTTSWVLALEQVMVVSRGSSTIDRLLVVLYPLVDLVLLTLATHAIVQIRQARRRVPRALWVMWSGFAGLAIADTMSVWDVAHQTVTALALYQALWPALFVVIAIAALCDGASRPRSKPERAGTRPYGLFTPYAAVTIALIATAVASNDHLGRATAVMWGGLIAALMARQVVATYENRALTDDLELRVEERTRELGDSEQRFSALVRYSSDVVAVVDEQLRLTYLSDSVTNLLGHKPSDLIGRDVEVLFDTPDGRGLRVEIGDTLEGGAEHRVVRAELAHIDGTRRIVQATLTNMTQRVGVRGIVLNMRDVTAQYVLEERLVHDAMHDSLTGLSNRALLLERLEQALSRSAHGVAIIFIDIDDFKRVNDTLGHVAGDQLLEAIALRLTSCVRESETVARLGGDEFAVLLESTGADVTPMAVAERICAALRRPVHVEGRDIAVLVSVGVAIADDGDDASRLLQYADLAIYRAKDENPGGYAVYDPSMHSHYLARIQTEEDLRSALREGGLDVHYQPIFDLRTGRLLALEALVRWDHPHRGMIPPAQFIPAAEASGLIDQVGRFVIARALRNLARWRARHPDSSLYVSINMSAAELREPTQLIEFIGRELRASGVPADALVLEITESMLLEDTRQNIHTLERLRELGVRIAIDDFGTGYSSLSYLQRFPADILKVDRSFIAALQHGPREAEFVHTIVQLGRNLGLVTLAEGVETFDQWHSLTEIGCRLAQGSVFSMAAPAGEVDTRLDEWLSVGAPRSGVTEVSAGHREGVGRTS